MTTTWINTAGKGLWYMQYCCHWPRHTLKCDPAAQKPRNLEVPARHDSYIAGNAKSAGGWMDQLQDQVVTSHVR